MKNAPLLNFALAVFLALSIGWLLYAGRAIILPLVGAVIAVYIIISATDGLKRLPGFRHVSDVWLRLAILAIFSIPFLFLVVLASATVREIAEVAPIYEANLDLLIDRAAAKYSLDKENIWNELRAVTIESFDLRLILLKVLSGFTNMSTSFLLIVIYAAFLLGERKAFKSKVLGAFPTVEEGQKTLDLMNEINTRVGYYLVTKTLINVLLAVVSFVILKLFGIDFAFFWAVVIGLLNYIPYIGSYLGVAFPVILSLAQFVSIPLTISLGVCLGVVQFVVGNIVEPRVIGHRVDLSPTVVLVALSFWAALWGIPGAILAVPMTSVLAIIFSSFQGTQFIGRLLADKIAK
ncbi:AI-2E family transporter [Falsihalocynthiibacter sp. SS001]|uniref:AI-2E family transporter n=1 Tax=Falsihalocynthiibacter sp. SS001 TaxID=3349698 RepID=UPI0036D3CFC6